MDERTVHCDKAHNFLVSYHLSAPCSGFKVHNFTVLIRCNSCHQPGFKRKHAIKLHRALPAQHKTADRHS